MIIICGESIAEVERDLEMAKRAIATGAPMGIGGATMADVEKAMAMLKGECGGITNPNYVAPKPCCCGCDCECEEDEDEWDCEDEDEDDVDCCPACGAGPDDYDVMCDTCDACGYGYEDDEEDEEEAEEDEGEDEDEIVPPVVTALVEMLRYLGADEQTIDKLLS